MDKVAEIAVCAVLITACEHTTDRHAAVDDPPPVPRPRGELAPVEGVGSPGGMSEEKAAECGRGTGRNQKGDCVPLNTRDAGHVQQVQIPAGSFVMGHPPSAYDAEAGRTDPVIRWSGQPPRPVSLPSFWIDLHEVTREAYDACVRTGSCTPASCPAGKDPVAGLSPELARGLPQTCVSHGQAETFCRVHGGRLPREAEWEYAARGIDARIYPWGNQLSDELPSSLTPAGRFPFDPSYFGILGLGTNGAEWVAERWDADAALRAFLPSDFRSPTGPMRAAMRAIEKQLGGRAVDLFVVKGTTSGRRRAGFDHPPEGLDTSRWDDEAWATSFERIGFRCVADLDPDRDERLDVPDSPPMVPLIRDAGVLDLFGGVAEVVSRSEAKKFCDVLEVDTAGGRLDDWRLPSAEEVRSIADNFRGPGPFWITEGAIAQRGTEATPLPTDPWVAVPAKDDEPLAARCVRTSR